MTEDIDRHDRPGAPAQAPLDIGRIESVDIRQDVDEDGDSANLKDHTDAGGESEGRYQDLVSPSHAQGLEGEVKSGGAGADRYRMRDTEIVGHGLLKGLGAWAQGETAGAQDLHHRRDVSLVEIRRRHRDGRS